MQTPRLLDGRLKLRHLVLIDALARRGSIVGAATELHVTQPVATRSLQELEGILGVTLFGRGPRGITSTVFGDAFVQHARAVIAQLTQAGRHVVELVDADRGTVVVGIHLAGSTALLPRAIAALKDEHPYLTVIVREGAPDGLLADLEAGRIDLIVGRLTAPSTDTITRRKLYDESIDLIVRAEHPLAVKAGIHPAELASYPWIVPGTETSLRRELEEWFTRNGMSLPANRVETTSFLTVRQLLRERDVIAALPSLIVRDDPTLTTLPVSLDPVGHSVGITMRAERMISPSIDALVSKLSITAAMMTNNEEEPDTGTNRPDR